jgi:hypothetical protein
LEQPEEFVRFRRLVLDDPALQARLREIRAWPAFVEASVDAAAERGVALTSADLVAARAAATASWLERWV